MQKEVEYKIAEQGIKEIVEAYKKGGQKGLVELGRKRDEDHHKYLLAEMEKIRKEREQEK